MTCLAQTPAVNMKRKSSTNCMIGDNVHPLHKATKLSKVSCSEVETAEQSAVLNYSIESSSDVVTEIPSYDINCLAELPGQNVDVNGDNDRFDELARVCPELLKLFASPPDPLSTGQMDSHPIVCPSDLKTILLANIEHDDTLTRIMNHNGVRDEQLELPHLVADDSDEGSCTSSDFQSYNELDFYIAENAPAPPFDRDMGFADIMTSIWDFDCGNSDAMIDMADRYMFLPFLEKKAEPTIPDDDWVEGVMMNSDDACFYLEIHHIKSDQETDRSCVDDPEESDWLDKQLVCRSFPEFSEEVSSNCPSWIFEESRERKRVTLVLDLDETLVHSTLEHCDDADFTFQVPFDMKSNTVYVRRRPYLQLFLERVAQLFEVVIFTASQSIYAEQLLDILDPVRNLISQRMFRESCVFSDGSYTKDLTVLGVDLAKIAIVDNTPQVFRLQVNNGIPIKSWFDDPSDCALLLLLPFLETLVDADDVRPLIAKRYSSTE